MPPKPQFTRREIAAAALAIIKEQGLHALTARGLGARLGASARPIFTVFQSMDEVKDAARELAFAEYCDFLDLPKSLNDMKYLGLRTVEFSMEYPALFRLLYLQKQWNTSGVSGSLPDQGRLAEECDKLIAQSYGIRVEDASLLSSQFWIHVFGMGAMCAIGATTLQREEITKRLSLSFDSLLMLIRSGRLDEISAEAGQQGQ